MKKEIESFFILLVIMVLSQIQSCAWQCNQSKGLDAINKTLQEFKK